MWTVAASSRKRLRGEGRGDDARLSSRRSRELPEDLAACLPGGAAVAEALIASTNARRRVHGLCPRRAE
jgi:hypothetical protein